MREPDDAPVTLRDLDALGESSKGNRAKPAVLSAHAPAGKGCEAGDPIGHFHRAFPQDALIPLLLGDRYKPSNCAELSVNPAAESPIMHGGQAFVLVCLDGDLKC